MIAALLCQSKLMMVLDRREISLYDRITWRVKAEINGIPDISV